MSGSAQRQSKAVQSPSRPPESQVEILYNTAVQSFVRRDHPKTHATLSRLLKVLQKSQNTHNAVMEWYHLPRPGESTTNGSGLAGGSSDPTNAEWTIKSLKLLISAYASLYADPPSNTSTLPPDLAVLLPPSSPRQLLEHVCAICTDTYFPPSSSTSISASSIHPPQLLSTLILAALKLRPTGPALDFAHKVTEDWLAALPDEFILAISPANASSRSQTGMPAEARKRLEGAREGYMKVAELFVGEVLAREGEWEMARAFLDGETVLASKRKEALYRHLRSLQTKLTQPAPTASPSSSLLLPVDNNQPSPSPKVNGSGARSRSDSTSSSSSERTARPPGVVASSNGGLTPSMFSSMKLPLPQASDRKGKSRAVSDAHKVNGDASSSSMVEGAEANGSKTKLPSSRATGHSSSSSHPMNKRIHAPRKVHERQPPSRAREPPTALSRLRDMTLQVLPPSVSMRLVPIFHSPIGRYLPVPLFVIPFLLVIMGIRRRLKRRGGKTSPLLPTTTSGVMTTADVRAKLALARARAREQGWIQWIWFYIRWWLDKFGGVWKLGTTITYV